MTNKKITRKGETGVSFQRIISGDREPQPLITAACGEGVLLVMTHDVLLHDSLVLRLVVDHGDTGRNC